MRNSRRGALVYSSRHRPSGHSARPAIWRDVVQIIALPMRLVADGSTEDTRPIRAYSCHRHARFGAPTCQVWNKPCAGQLHHTVRRLGRTSFSSPQARQARPAIIFRCRHAPTRLHPRPAEENQCKSFSRSIPVARVREAMPEIACYKTRPALERARRQGGKVKSSKQAIAIALSKATQKERKCPERSAEPLSRELQRTMGFMDKAVRRSSGTAKIS